jgi:hypothetical protein
MVFFLITGMMLLGLFFLMAVLSYTGILMGGVMVAAFYAANFASTIIGVIAFLTLVVVFGDYYTALAALVAMLVYGLSMIVIIHSVYNRSKHLLKRK